MQLCQSVQLQHIAAMHFPEIKPGNYGRITVARSVGIEFLDLWIFADLQLGTGAVQKWVRIPGQYAAWPAKIHRITARRPGKVAGWKAHRGGIHAELVVYQFCKFPEKSSVRVMPSRGETGRGVYRQNYYWAARLSGLLLPVHQQWRLFEPLGVGPFRSAAFWRGH